MDVSDIGFALRPAWDKAVLTKMIEELGREETVRRFAWLYDESEGVVDRLIEQFLTDDFVDDQGTAGGHYFWESL